MNRTPQWFATVLLAMLPISAQSWEPAPYKVGDARIVESSEILIRDGLVVTVRDVRVENVSDTLSLSIAKVGPGITLPAKETLDLSCGTLEWKELSNEERDDLWGRTEYVLRRNGELTGVVGLVGPGGISNPRSRGRALPSIMLRDGELQVDVHPPFEGIGSTRFRVYVAATNTTNRMAFRTIVASATRWPKAVRAESDER